MAANKELPWHSDDSPEAPGRKLLWANLWMRIIFGFSWVLGWIRSRWESNGFKPARSFETGILAIEAGQSAWEHIFFKELAKSAEEFLGEERVLRLAVRPEDNYVRQVKEFVKKHPTTHYFYDPRTGSQSWVPALWESIQLLVFFAGRRVTPIAYCTDISIRRWRYQVALVSALRGVCVCLSNASLVRKMFPHSRIIGPSLMPLSQSTFGHLGALNDERRTCDPLTVSFFGSLYEPRRSQLQAIRDGLIAEGIEFTIRGRALGGKRIPDDEYWQAILSSDILVSTSSQAQNSRLDFGEINHLIYRFTEALACGVCLVAENAPGARRFFDDGTDLILWNDTNEAVEAVVDLVKNPSKVERIRNQGKDTIRQIVESRFFWAEIDGFLGKQSHKFL